MNRFRIIMTAAHAGYDSERQPLGGAAAICERLARCWSGCDDVELAVVGSGPRAPCKVPYMRVAGLGDRTPADLNELQYARFCRAFEDGCTQYIRQQGGPLLVVTHDISEGPTFGELKRAMIPVVCLIHVDVVDYFTRMYLGGRVSAPTAARLASKLPVMPDLLRLVFDKQADAATHCDALVVPSAGMREVLLQCYPQAKVKVVPWGTPGEQHDPAEIEAERAHLRGEWGSGSLITTLSRISPEKGQDLLLRAIGVGEQRREVPPGTQVVICGEPAYMRGPRYMRRLHKLAGKLRTPVIFPGHLGNARKRAALELSTVFVSASRHESYGLTTMEAFAAGLPVVAVRTHGSEETVDNSCGTLLDPTPPENLPDRLWSSVRDILLQPAERDRLSRGALQRAARDTFTHAADRLLDLAREILL